MDWTIYRLYYKTTSGSLSNVVSEVHSKFSDTVSGKTEEEYHVTSNLRPVAASNFVAYNDLNENTVKGWVQNAEGNYWGALTSSIATQISSSLAEQITPTIQSGKPW